MSSASRGFTLIELLIAVMILLFAMAGIVPFFLTGLSQASSLRYRSVATNIARERMEEIRQLDYREITETPSEGTTLDQRFGNSTTERGVTFNVSYAVEVEPYEQGTLKKVTVNVGWTTPPAVSAASLTTLIHQQFLGPRGAYLEIVPTSPDPLGTPFPAITGSRPVPRTTTARYHLAEADWGLVYDNLNLPGMTARNVYMRLVFFDDTGQSIAVGDPSNDSKIDKTYLRYTTGSDGKVNDIWFEYNFDANLVPDGYWEARAIAYNEYDEPGNLWRLRTRVEMGPPAAPSPFIATPQADNQTVVLTWTGGPERDRAYYVLQREKWTGTMWPDVWTTVAGNLDPKAGTYTDQGSVADQLDPWGISSNQNQYQYRLWAVDICNPGLAGPAALAQVAIPPGTTTTTTASTTTTTAPTTTTTSTSTTTTTQAQYSAKINNTKSQDYSITIRDAGNNIVYTGTATKRSTLTINNLVSGNFMITATSPGKQTLYQSFSLPAQKGQTVMTIASS